MKVRNKESGEVRELNEVHYERVKDFFEVVKEEGKKKKKNSKKTKKDS